MQKIKYIRPSRDGKRATLCLLSEEGEQTYSVSAALVSELSLYRGRELDDREYDAVLLEDERYKIMRRALAILAGGDNSARTLYMKLLKHTQNREVIEEVIAECIRLGYIDEVRQLLRLVENEANRALRGRHHIMRRLVAKGYRASMVHAAIEQLLEAGEIDFSESFERLAEKMGADDEEARLRLAYKAGFRRYDVD